MLLQRQVKRINNDRNQDKILPRVRLRLHVAFLAVLNVLQDDMLQIISWGLHLMQDLCGSNYKKLSWCKFKKTYTCNLKCPTYLLQIISIQINTNESVHGLKILTIVSPPGFTPKKPEKTHSCDMSSTLAGLQFSYPFLENLAAGERVSGGFFDAQGRHSPCIP